VIGRGENDISVMRTEVTERERERERERKRERERERERNTVCFDV